MLDNSAAIHEIKDELKKIQTKLQEQSIHQQKKSDQKLESAIEELKQIQTSHTNQTTEHKKSNQKLASTIELLNRVQFNMQTQSDELKKLETAVTNQTKQQGLLQNLILDLNKNSKCDQKAENSEEGFNGECVICLVKPVTHALIPCGHVFGCSDCAKTKPEECPICRSTVNDSLRIFFP